MKKVFYVIPACLLIAGCTIGPVESSSTSSSTSVSSEVTSISSSISSSSSSVQEYFTVVWKNYDGTILETDENVYVGTIASYGGATPTRENTSTTTYTFVGWTPKVGEIYKNTTYTAIFSEHTQGEESKYAPKVDSTNKKVTYGIYPQSRVGDTNIISALEDLPYSELGLYTLGDDYYVKQIAQVYNDENYEFNDKSLIENNCYYWFKCEEISWKILSSDNSTYTLVSNLLLDAFNYNDTYESSIQNDVQIYSNNYKESAVRKWLNENFFNFAFMFHKSAIISTNVDNSAQTTSSSSNIYVCEDTMDKVCLLSYQDYLNVDYGFGANPGEIDTSKQVKTTDYVRARGGWYNIRDNGLTYQSSYWTRSPSSEFAYAAMAVNSAGVVSSYSVERTNHCIRPSITIYVGN